jgi:hypothetical protein
LISEFLMARARSIHTTEGQRLTKPEWKRWGPYLSERQWGTVREDYSADGSAWEYFSHDQARSRAYRWGEDGMAGLCDDHQQLCFALALWNGRDPILKERMFGLSGHEGNHGEDVKEYYFYLDSTPTHSYMKYLYKYPQAAYPYELLVAENRRHGRDQPEYELLDTGIFDEDRYFDVFVEYAKLAPEDIAIRIKIINRGPETADLVVLPSVWFRNTWSWSVDGPRPSLRAVTDQCIEASHGHLGKRWLYGREAVELLFTENESNLQRLFGIENRCPYVKDAFHRFLIEGDRSAVNPARCGTKAVALHRLTIPPQGRQVLQLRLSDQERLDAPFEAAYQAIWATRRREADAFYDALNQVTIPEDLAQVQRQAFAGMLWSKQTFHYDVTTWLHGDPTQPSPPPERRQGRNAAWFHLDAADVLSMPDKWEYPWFAAWDLAFHSIPLCSVDPEFAKNQLDLMTREWYMHPNGQIPAYEWNFSDVNPPVHAWATWQVYSLDKQMSGVADRSFLERIFQKLLMNFTWWVNRKDEHGRNVFEGGFLGLDNIGVFDRSAPLPTGGFIEQSDGTSWMAMYCLNMLTIALELAMTNPVYEDMATKFFEHFLYIANAMNHIGNGTSLWDEEDQFYYDVLNLPPQQRIKLKVRSVVGMIPLFAVMTLEPEMMAKVPAFTNRVEWFIDNRPDLRWNVSCMRTPGHGKFRLLSIVWKERLVAILQRLLDEDEFFGDYGIRAVSRFHRDHPYIFHAGGRDYRVEYEPAESGSGLYGGNSNWRGPIWFPLNVLLIESLIKFHQYHGDDVQVECPKGSGRFLTLQHVAIELRQRLISQFLRDGTGRRPIHGDRSLFQNDPHWADLLLFYEYFHGDTGSGLGASHQTGWTGLVASLIQQQADSSLPPE